MIPRISLSGLRLACGHGADVVESQSAVAPEGALCQHDLNHPTNRWPHAAAGGAVEEFWSYRSCTKWACAVNTPTARQSPQWGCLSSPGWDPSKGSRVTAWTGRIAGESLLASGRRHSSASASLWRSTRRTDRGHVRRNLVPDSDAASYCREGPQPLHFSKNHPGASHVAVGSVWP